MTAPMPATPGEPPREPIEPSGGFGTTVWGAIIAVLICLVIIGLITYGAEKSSAEAEQKAAQLQQKFRAAGLRVPVNQKMIVRSLGNDGGNVCDNPASALGKATLFDQITNGADFVGRRPVIIDDAILVGGALILQTYCPEKLEQFKDKFDDLKTDDTIKD